MLRSASGVVTYFFRRRAVSSLAPFSSSSKVFPTCSDALHDLQDGATVLFGGFGVCGIPENLISTINKKKTKNLTIVSNDAGTEDFGLGLLIRDTQVSRVFASYVGENKKITDLLNSGDIELNLIPQGTLVEKLRNGGAGVPAFYSPAGVGTDVESGLLPLKMNKNDKTVEKYSEKKEVRMFHGKKYLLEESLTGEFACIKAWKADRSGNLVFRGTARNFNPECAKAGRITVAEVEEIVENGQLTPDEIHLPGIYVHRIVKGEKFEKRIAKKVSSEQQMEVHHRCEVDKENRKGMEECIRDRIAQRVAKELKDGMYVNLGIGIPTLASNFIPKDITVTLQSENGMLGVGPYPHAGKEDPDFVNAGKETISVLPGSAVFSSGESFAMIRGGHIDLTILGALEVSSSGDLASWVIPGSSIKGMGGAMDLVSACKKIIVAMNHTNLKNGKSKILSRCSLPLTGKGVVDMIITELAVFSVNRNKPEDFTLLEIAEGVTVEELKDRTEASFKIGDNLKYF